ncbi:MAG: HK97 family phage prohead protease [Shimia sp.]
MTYDMELEHKFTRVAVAETDEGFAVEGYASRFGIADRGRDVVEPGAYGASLAALSKAGRCVKMLWQHDPAQPIGTWDEVREDATGLWVRGRLLPGVAKADEAAALLKAGAIDGLSIGYRVVRATKDKQGLRHLHELELWEVSLVTFPMLPEARVDAKGEAPQAAPVEAALRDIAEALGAARTALTGGQRP